MVETQNHLLQIQSLLNKATIGPLNCTLKGTTGKELHCYYWKPQTNEIRGIIMLCHGFGEYLSWYEELATNLIAKGYLVFGHDHVGHGKSEGMKGKVESMSNLVGDIFLHVALLKQIYPDKSAFLIGHSMGGMITALCASKKEMKCFQGMILLGPLINSNSSQNTVFHRSMAKVLNCIAPNFVVGELDVNLITHCEDKKNQLLADPLLWKGGIRACTAVAFMSGMEEISKSTSEIDIPFLLIHGEKDMLCCPEASRQFFEKASSSDKTFQLIPGMLHNPCQETPEYKNKVFEELVKWINDRTSSIS